VLLESSWHSQLRELAERERERHPFGGRDTGERKAGQAANAMPILSPGFAQKTCADLFGSGGDKDLIEKTFAGARQSPSIE
jgi:hypothetical protein